VGATVVWAQAENGGPELDENHFTDNGDKTATFTAPIEPDQDDQIFTFEATASASGWSDGTATRGFILRNFTETTQVATRTSGAASPGDTVTLSPGDLIPHDWFDTMQWEQDEGNEPAVTPLTPDGWGGVTFTAPGVTETTDLTFTVRTNGCGLGELTGSATVPVQVAEVTFDLPTSITVGDTLDLDDDDNPDTGEKILTITGAPADPEILFFAAAVGNGELPAGVELTIDQDTGVMTVTTGAGETIQVTVQVFGTAGLLAEVSDTINIVVSE